MPDQFPSDKAEKIVVRLPDGMRDRLAAVAKVNKRSVNAEVVARLEKSFPAHDPEMTELVDKMEKVPPHELFRLASKIVEEFQVGLKTLMEKAQEK